MSISPQFDTDDYRHWVQQADFLDFLEANRSGGEVVLYASVPPFIFMHCILVPLRALRPLDVLDVTDVMSWSCNPTSSWSITHTLPDKGKLPKAWITPPLDSCGSTTLAKGEQLLFLREFDGRQEDQVYFEVSQKLTHAHGLHYVPERRAFCCFDQNGDIDEVIRITFLNDNRLRYDGRVVTVRRDVLDLHLMLTNSALVQLFDSIRFDPDNLSDKTLFSRETIESYERQLFYHVAMQPNHSRFHGFQVLTTQQPRKPLLRRLINGHDEEKQYATFIAHDWRHGEVRELSCDPHQLANYFVESDLPFETTPAFFRPDVLMKYKSDPSKYQLNARSITCRHAWHLVTYDINEAGQVHTYLIYLSYLPYQEQLYWKSFNEPPKAPISKRAYTTDFKGQFDDSPNALEELKSSLRHLLHEKASWWKLRNPELMQRLHYPVTAAPEEWANEILMLDQLVFEGLERSYFKDKAESLGCTVDPRWNTIRVMKESLEKAEVDPDETKAMVDPLQELHTLRNKMKGHASGHEAKKIRAELIRKHVSLKQHFATLTMECHQAVKLIRVMVQQDIL
jgi:hypothetical protein